VRRNSHVFLWELPEAACDGAKELDGLDGAVVGGGGEAGDDGGPRLDMGEVAGTDHGAEDGSGVESVARLGGGDGKEAEAVGVEAVELALMAEARYNGLRAREGGESVLVR